MPISPGREAEFRPIRWERGRIVLLDQTRLPEEEMWLQITDVETLCEAIRSLRVRGAPAIGIAAAYGIAMAAWNALSGGNASRSQMEASLEGAQRALAATRPTAANLFWALETMRAEAAVAEAEGDDLRATAERLERRALELHEDDLRRGRAIGAHGADLLPENAVVLTHCNAGALATGGFGTALGVVRVAAERGRLRHVFATETRPLLQGARLTVWELGRLGIPHTLIIDSAAAFVMKAKGVDAVVVGADRIAANGDVANKVGTYALALEARGLGIPLYVAAPANTVDLSVGSGEAIPIEERAWEEVTTFGGRRIAPEGTQAFTPAFDVTPHALIAAIVTERGVISPVTEEGIREHLRDV